MRLILVAGLLVSAGFAAAQPAALDGAKFTVETTQAGRPVPFSLPIGQPAPDVLHMVAQNDAGVRLPLQLLGDRVYGMLPADLPAGSHQFTVRKEKTSIGTQIRLDAPEGKKNVIDVRIGEDLLTSYHYSTEDRKPYLWPLLGEGGASLTRDWPFSGKEGKTKDHPHHVSFWTAHGDLNGADFWEYGERTGWQEPCRTTIEAGYDVASISTYIKWTDKDRKDVIDEYRTYRFYATPANHRFFDVEVKFVAAYGDVKFGDTKEGGIVGLRMNDDLRETGGTGKITTSEGAVGEKAAWGKPAAWCDYTGTLDGFGVRGITVMNHPGSFRYPIRWHVRAYGLLGANAFGYSDFTEGKENGEYTLKNGETMEFAFRIYLHSGDASVADVAGYFKDYANPPKAEWVK